MNVALNLSDCQEIVLHSDDAFAPVGYLKFLKMHLEEKYDQVEEK